MILLLWLTISLIEIFGRPISHYIIYIYKHIKKFSTAVQRKIEALHIFFYFQGDFEQCSNAAERPEFEIEKYTAQLPGFYFLFPLRCASLHPSLESENVRRLKKIGGGGKKELVAFQIAFRSSYISTGDVENVPRD